MFVYNFLALHLIQFPQKKECEGAYIQERKKQLQRSGSYTQVIKRGKRNIREWGMRG